MSYELAQFRLKLGFDDFQIIPQNINKINKITDVSQGRNIIVIRIVIRLLSTIYTRIATKVCVTINRILYTRALQKVPIPIQVHPGMPPDILKPDPLVSDLVQSLCYEIHTKSGQVGR